MTDATAEQIEAPKPKRKSGIILAGILAIAGAAAGYYLTASGILNGGHGTAGKHGAAAEATPSALPAVGYVDLHPFVISVEAGSNGRHLRFHAQLEVDEAYLAEVEKLRPRILDLLNGYLRAVEISDLQDPLALTRLRGHMLRRINIVVGDGRVRDVLIMEFVLS